MKPSYLRSGFGGRKSKVWALALLLSGCVTLGKPWDFPDLGRRQHPELTPPHTSIGGRSERNTQEGTTAGPDRQRAVSQEARLTADTSMDRFLPF